MTHATMPRKATALLLCAVLLLALFGAAPLPAKAQSVIEVNVSSPTNIPEGSVEVDNTTKTIKLTGAGNTYLLLGSTTDMSVVVTADANLILNNVHIDLSEAKDHPSAHALSIAGQRVTVTLAEGSHNILAGADGDADTGSPNGAGLHVPRSTTLTLEGAGYLTATGRDYAAGIGGGGAYDVGDDVYIGEHGGQIIINSGTITATGGVGGAGIGGGAFGDGIGTLITGGTITATGGMGGAGIGGGARGKGGAITIAGGTITATAQSSGDTSGGGSGIGGGGGMRTANGAGADGGAGGIILITGGIITATGNQGGADSPDLGGGGSGIGGGGGDGADDGDNGGGTGGDAGNITITGGTIVATGGKGIGVTNGSGAGSGVGGGGGGHNTYGAGSPGSRGRGTIMGGSLFATAGTDGHLDLAGQPTAFTRHNDGVRVYPVTLQLEGLSTKALITAGSIDGTLCQNGSAPSADGGYNLHHVQTNDAGQLYPWLPEARTAQTISLRTDDNLYMKSFARPAGNTLSTTLPRVPSEEITKHTISFDINGGTGSAPAAQKDLPYLSKVTLPTVEGMTPPADGFFGGWRIDKTGLLYLSEGSYYPTADVTFYAVWDSNATATFHLNGGTGTVPPSMNVASFTLPIDANMTPPAGRVFGGWRIGDAGALYAARDVYQLENSVVFYAQWVVGTPPSVGALSLGVMMGDPPAEVAISLGSVAVKATVTYVDTDVATVSPTELATNGALTITPVAVGYTPAYITFFNAAGVRMGNIHYLGIYVVEAGTILPTASPTALHFTLGGAPQRVSYTMGTKADGSPFAARCSGGISDFIDGTFDATSVTLSPLAVGSGTLTLTFRDAQGATIYQIFLPVTVTDGGTGGETGGGTMPPSEGTTPVAGTLVQTKAVAQLDAALLALPTGENTLALTFIGYGWVGADTLSAMAERAATAGVALTLHFDTLKDGAMLTRVSVDLALYQAWLAAQGAPVGNASAPQGLSTSPATTAQAVRTSALFNTHFQPACLALDLSGLTGAGISVSTAVRQASGAPALTYVYNPSANAYHLTDVPLIQQGGISVLAPARLVAK